MNTEQFDGHTPGPWDYQIPETGDNNIVDKEGEFVAQVANREDGKNAQLIAAAPDLLAEVKRLREALSTCLWHAETDGTSFGSDFPLHDIIEVCNWALNDEEDEEE